jgi:hypothetical protein
MLVSDASRTVSIASSNLPTALTSLTTAEWRGARAVSAAEAAVRF